MENKRKSPVVSIVVSCVSRSSGGLINSIQGLYKTELLSSLRLNVFGFTDKYTSEDLKTWGKIKVNAFPKSLTGVVRLYKGLSSAHPDICQIEGLWRSGHCLIYPMKHIGKTLLVCTPHGMLDPYIITQQGLLKRIVAKLLFNRALKTVDCYHALSMKEMEDIRAYGIKAPIAVIPNCVTIPEEKTFARQDDKLHLLYLGRIDRKKGIDLIVGAWHRLKETKHEGCDRWVIDIVGWGDRHYIDEIKAMISNYEMDDVIIHGPCYGDELDRIYSTSDAFILPSHGEGLPMSVLEAWSHRLCVVMSPHCNLPEGFEHDAAIRVMDNAESVAEGMSRLLMMTDEDRKAIGNNGFELVKSKFEWKSSALKMIQLYSWLLGEGEKPDFVYLGN